MSFYKKKSKARTITKYAFWISLIGTSIVLLSQHVSPIYAAMAALTAVFVVTPAAGVKHVVKRARKNKVKQTREKDLDKHLQERGISLDRFKEMGGIPNTEIDLDLINYKVEDVVKDSYIEIAKKIKDDERSR